MSCGVLRARAAGMGGLVGTEEDLGEHWWRGSGFGTFRRERKEGLWGSVLLVMVVRRVVRVDALVSV